MKPEIFYPYNETFKYYGPPRAGKRAQEYCDEQNECFGGHWVLHTKDQHDDWWNSVGRAQFEAKEYLEKNRLVRKQTGFSREC